MSAETSDIKDSLVLGHNSQGAEIRGCLLRLTRCAAVFEVYDPTLVLRASEVIEGCSIQIHERTLYEGRAVVRSLVSTGLVMVCEVELSETGWRDVEFSLVAARNGKLRLQLEGFISEWQKTYRVAPEYKVIIADMQTYLSELRLWLDQVELGIRASPSEDRVRLENEVVEELAQPVIPDVNHLFEQFEAVAQRLPEELLPAHRGYMRRQLHPLVLCSPFAYRTFHKPLGYAGDYEMVNMILRNQPEGSSLFAKVVNTWFIRQPPAVAHRNRIKYLAEMMLAETLRLEREQRPARIFSVACGPAQEVLRFLSQAPERTRAQLTLLDFNEETLQYTRASLGAVKTQFAHQTTVQYIRKSVQQIMKEWNRTVSQPEAQYDLVYCAGLFDYLPNTVCRRLMDIMYEWVAPGGLLISTNVEPSNPLRNGMDHLLEWHLIYRTAEQMRHLIPSRAPDEAARVCAEETGVNLFLEVRKPTHA